MSPKSTLIENLKRKLVFNLVERDDAEAIGAIAIKKEDRSGLKLPKLRRLEDCATTPLPDKFTLLSLGDKNDQLIDAYNITMRLNKHLCSW